MDLDDDAALRREEDRFNRWSEDFESSLRGGLDDIEACMRAAWMARAAGGGRHIAPGSLALVISPENLRRIEDAIFSQVGILMYGAQPDRDDAMKLILGCFDDVLGEMLR